MNSFHIKSLDTAAIIAGQLAATWTDQWSDFPRAIIYIPCSILTSLEGLRPLHQMTSEVECPLWNWKGQLLRKEAIDKFTGVVHLLVDYINDNCRAYKK